MKPIGPLPTACLRSLRHPDTEALLVWRAQVISDALLKVLHKDHFLIYFSGCCCLQVAAAVLIRSQRLSLPGFRYSSSRLELHSLREASDCSPSHCALEALAQPVNDSVMDSGAGLEESTSCTS